MRTSRVLLALLRRFEEVSGMDPVTFEGLEEVREARQLLAAADEWRPAAELGEVLAVLRIARGMRQKELAQASGLRPETVADYERGRIVPGVNTVHRVLRAMGYSFESLDHARGMLIALHRTAVVKMTEREVPS
jgi:DNA-binding XRE family transcriptional regulator